MITRYLKNFFIILILIFTYNCGFKPVLIGSDYNFSILVDKSSGNDQVNYKIKEKLKVVDGRNRTFKVIINTEETIKTISKDLKGDPTIYEIEINLDYKLTENNKVLIHKSSTQSSTYNNIQDKFELSKSKEILRENLIDNLVSDIINSAGNLIVNPMGNDN